MAETLKHICAVISAVLILMLACVAGAADIVPDPEFDGDGLTITKIGAGRDEAQAIAVQDDGRIIVAGQSGHPDNSEMTVVRYLPDGSVDREFSFTGGPLIGTGFGSDGVRALQIDPDGRIVLGGYATENLVTYGALVRLLDDGRLDYSFGEQGIVLFDRGESDFYDIEFVDESNLVAVGSFGSGDARVPLLAGFDQDGLLDQSFGFEGVQMFSDLPGELRGLALLENNGLIGGGYALEDQQKKQLLLLRLNDAGVLGESFSDQGVLIANDIDSEVEVHDVGTLLDGRIVAVGEAVDEDGSSSIMVSRFLADGRPDTSLSESGVLSYDIGEESGVYGVSVLDNGVILAAGYRRDGDDRNTVILRLEPSGNNLREIDLPDLDETSSDFGEEIVEIVKISALQVEDGSFSDDVSESQAAAGPEADIFTTTLEGSDEESQAIAALDDGTIYTAGSSGTDEDSAILVTKFSSETELQSSESNFADPSKFYNITTQEITNVTRVGAQTGGMIEEIDFDDGACADKCEELCDEDSVVEPEPEDSMDIDEPGSGIDSTDSEDALTCREECLKGCIGPTVEKRGVVYSVDPNPEYDPDGDTTSPGDDEENGDDGVVTDPDDSDGEDDSGGNPFGRESLLNLDDYFVTFGQTDDGEGAGDYSSTIEDVNPQTAYYVRAYALLSDGTVIYGDEKWFQTRDSCFIATAAFGSIDMAGVRILRQFRDRYLKSSEPGRTVVGWYYQISPPIADLVAASTLLRSIVAALLLPVMLWAWLMLNLELAAVVLTGVLLIRYFMTGRLRRTFV